MKVVSLHAHSGGGGGGGGGGRGGRGEGVHPLFCSLLFVFNFLHLADPGMTL